MDNQTCRIFIITPVGVENLLIKELTNKGISFEKQYVTEGGVELDVKISDILYIGKSLKLATRILLRVKSFKCRDTPKLFNKIRKINWKEYIYTSNVEVSCSSVNSRLFDDRKISKAIVSGIDKYFQGSPPKKKHLEGFTSTVAIYSRFEEDLCTISLDLTGDRLDRRLPNKGVGIAPIREQLAAAINFYFKNTYPEIENIIDPMCGSGTILIEGYNFNNLSDKKLLMEDLPISKNFESSLALIHGKLFSRFIGIERDLKTFKYLLKNTEDLNFFELINEDYQNTSVNVCTLSGAIVNPPYGKRIALDKSPGDYYFNLVENLFNVFSMAAVGIIIPAEYDIQKIKNHYNVKGTLKFKNGGIPVNFICLDRLQS